MPRVDELPLPAQNEIRASRGESTEPPAVEKRRASLLQRLASVGLGRRDDAADDAAMAGGRTQAQSNLAPAGRRADESRGHDQRPQDMVSEYAKRAPAVRPAPQGLDPHGRPAPVRDSIDEDHLEIPAFLRRQAN